MITRRNLLIMLLAGLLVRELLSPWTGHPWDLEVFARVGYYASNGTNPYIFLDPVEGITFAPYGVMTSIGYPPPWALVCGFLYWVYATVGQVVAAPATVYYALLKQPAIFGDLLCAVIAARLVGGERAKKALMFWLFNPLVIIVSSVWGMFDSVVIMMSLLSLAWLIRSRSSAGGGILGLGAAFKLIPVIFAPIMMLYAKGKLKFLLGFLLVAAAAVLVPFLVFGWPLDGFIAMIASQAVNARDAPAVGGLTVFSVFEPINWFFPGLIPPGLFTALSYAWIPIFFVFYLKLWLPTLRGWFRRLSGKESTGASPVFSLEGVLRLLVIASILYLVTRVWVSDGYVLYLLAFLSLDVWLFHGDRGRAFTAVWLVALLFLVANNPLFIRFASPVSDYAFELDLLINNSLVSGGMRMVFKVVLGTAFYLMLVRLLMVYTGWSPPWRRPSRGVLAVGAKAREIREVSIGICAHNEERNIRQLLENLLWRQPLRGKALKEIIVVSSGSTDGTNGIVREVMKSSGKVILVEEDRRTGKSSAQNQILSRAGGDALVLISADTCPESGAVDALVGELEEGVGGAIANVRVSNSKSGVVNLAAHFSWELHNQTNARFAQLGIMSHLGGDMFAIRNGIVYRIPPSIILDDAYLGSVIHQLGYSIRKSDRAVVANLGPSTLRDFLEQRSRNLAGHLQLKRLGSSSSTFTGMMFRRPVLCLQIFIETCAEVGLKTLAFLPAIVSIELLAQALSRVRKDMEGLILWQPLSTTKERISTSNSCQG